MNIFKYHRYAIATRLTIFYIFVHSLSLLNVCIQHWKLCNYIKKSWMFFMMVLKYKSNTDHRNKTHASHNYLQWCLVFLSFGLDLVLSSAIRYIDKLFSPMIILLWKYAHGLLCLFSNPLFVQSFFVLFSSLLTNRSSFLSLLIPIYLLCFNMQLYIYKFCAGSMIVNNWIKFNIIFNIM